MSAAASRFCNGYVATPIIEACRRRGLFALLDRKKFAQGRHLIESTGAHPRYLTAALEGLVSLGWLEKNAKGEYRLSREADPDYFDFDLSSLYAVEASQLIRQESHVRQLGERLDRILSDSAPIDSLPRMLAQGPVFVPLLLALKDLDLENPRSELASLDPLLAQRLEKALLSQKWLARNRKGLTKSGRHLLEAGDLAFMSTYRPFLNRVEDLLFGDSPSALKEVAAIADDRDERTCLQELQEEMLSLFDRTDLCQQPRAIVDLGSGDGCLWEKIYRSVRKGTARGRNREAFPLEVLCFDRRRQSTGQVVPVRPAPDHRPFVDDFDEPGKVIQTLQAHGLAPKDKVLYLHALLNPAFPIGRSQDEGTTSQAPDDDASTLRGQWRAHLKRWGQRIGSSSLLLVEDHGAPVQHEAAPTHLRILRELGDRSSVSAEELIVLAASVGLFNDNPARRYPKVGNACRVSLHHLRRRDYIVRYVKEGDLPRLLELEALCWQHTRTPETQIRARLAGYPEGQFVLENDGRVLGVVYSQRIADVESLEGRNAADVHELHDPTGSVIQLLAVNVDPQAQNLQLGDQLLEFMLQRCSLMTGVDRVVGVTLCKSYDANGPRSFDDYIRLQGGEQDPVLTFHQDHGASIVRSLANYRPEDEANCGYGVIVSYDIQTRVPRKLKEASCAAEQQAAATRSGSAADRAQITEFVSGEVSQLLSDAGTSPDADRPLMELGLDSADLLKLQRRVEEKFGRGLAPAFFFQHNTIEKVAAHLAATLGPVAQPDDKAQHASGASLRESECSALDARSAEGVAVIGMSCKLPGGIETPEDLWRALVAGRSAIGAYPRARGDWPTDLEMPGIEQGGFVSDIDAFDSDFFRIPPREAQVIDPQQRMLLEQAWACLEDAGIPPAQLKGTRTGVFIGASNTDYGRLIQEAKLETQAHHATGNSLAVLANRLSYFFDLSGPSLLIDTACSASLVALHSAIQSLRAGECTAALVGGVNAICHPALSIAYHKAGMLAADGRCKVFDARANGYVRSEGVVVLLLKPLNAAIADGDRIHAVIRGSAVNHGGLAAGLTVPNPQKQSELLLAAWNNAGIAAGDLSYLEAHGTGTSLGDPIEVQGIETALAQLAPDPKSGTCFVGSVKSNLGHLESAAGLAGLLKVILCLRHRQLPASIHFEQLNPKIRLEGTRLAISQALQPWDVKGTRLAGVSSFGSGGANAHVVVQEYTSDAVAGDRSEGGLFVLSAADPDRLRDYAGSVLRWLEQTATEEEFADAIYTWQVGRTAMKHRLAMKVSDSRDLQGRLKEWLAGNAQVAINPPRKADARQAQADAQPVEADIDSALTEGNLERLGEIWASGVDIDWRKLYTREGGGQGRRRRISVPTYAFARDRFWVDVAPRATSGPEASKPLFFEENWLEETSNADHGSAGHRSAQGRAGAAVPADDAQTVIFADENFHNRIASSDSAGLFAHAALVSPAGEYRQASNREHLCRVDDPADFQRVLDSVAPPANRPIAIVYAWARGREEKGIHALFDFFKCVKESAHRIVHVTLVGQYDVSRVQTCWDYSWIGFERSLKLLLPRVRVSLLFTNDGSCTAAQLWDARQSAGVIWYQDETRRVLSCEQVTVPRTTRELVLKRQGGYLITGGCGALGLRFARYLAQKCQAKLLLVGRSELSPAIQAQLDLLKQAGAAEATYQALDISDRAAAMAWARSLPFELCGVIHAAGVQSLTSFDKRSTADIDCVLHPKTLGTMALDDALARQPLDFMCYFSSSSAMLGDFGACDYAVANRFQMAYAQYRAAAQRPGTTVVINWPLWKEGGMGPGDEGQTAFYLTSSGQEALDTDAGLEAWHGLLASGRLQTLVMVGQPVRVAQVLSRMYGSGQALRFTDVAQAPAASTAPTARTGEIRRLPLQEAVLSDVRQLVSACSGLAPGKLRIDANLADYGLDSIHLTDLAERLTRHFGVNVTPVVFFSHTTIQQLAKYFIDEHAARLRDLYRQSSADGASEPLRYGEVSAAPASKRAAAGTVSAEPIAVIGMSGRFPRARSVDDLWAMLAEGRSGITEIPATRWDWRDYFTAPGDPGNRITTNQGGFIDGVDEFDPLFFEISPREAQEMDPGERLLLMEAYRALEDAGLAPLSLAGSKVGVFVGMEEGQYDAITGRQGVTTSGAAMVSSRLSYFLDLHGPAVATNTACSSGLVALHQAVMSLRQGECEVALAAAVSLNLSPAGYIMMSEAGMLSRDGQCFSFSKRADGIGVGEAVVVLVLKPLSAALASGDTICGVIRASGINFDGKTNGVTAPSGRMQAQLIENLYTANDIDVGEITHIVTHGTGTPLGDPVEISALNAAFRKVQSQRGGPELHATCAITSCKSNLGHTLAASGLVSVVSLLQGMRHHRIPPTLNCEVESDYFAWADSPFYVNKAARMWQKNGDRPHVGAVSAYGRSGTNAHVVVEESPVRIEPAVAAGASSPRVIIPLSARTTEQLMQRARDLLAFLLAQDTAAPAGETIDLRSMAFTLQTGRDAMVERLGFIVGSVEELASTLQAWIDGRPVEEGVFRGSSKANQGALATLGDDDEGGQIIAKWLSQKKLEKLMDLWVNGMNLDWHRLHDGTPPRRMRLPTYPFAQERYWAQCAQVTQAPGTARASRALHPLLHENVSDLGAQRYVSHFSGDEPFLKDHRVLGQKVLPGVAYLEMVRAAVERAVPMRSRTGILELRNTVWIQPFVASPGRSITIALIDETSGDADPDSIAYEIYSVDRHADGTEQERVHCQGQAVFCDRPAAPKLDVASLESQMAPDRIEASNVYAAYRKMGLDYGPSFRGIGSILRGQRQLLARLSLPAAESDGAVYGLPPCLLDSALQSAIAFVDDLGQTPSRPSLPFELTTLRVIRPCPNEMLAWVREAGGARGSERNATLDVDLCDLAGEVCVQMRGFTSRAAAGEASAIAADVKPGLNSFVPVWNVVFPPPASPRELPQSAAILLLGDDRAALDFLRKSCPDASPLRLPADASIDVIRAELQNRSFEHLLWIAPDVMGASDPELDAAQIIARQQEGVLAVFRIAKALLGSRHAGKQLEWTLITRNTQGVRQGDRISPAHAGISGLIGSLAKECPHWKLRLVDVDDVEHLRLAECFALSCDPKGNGYALRQGEWFRQELAYLADPPQAAPVYKQNGVYVVIGGAGGLGEVWSRHLIEQYQARLVWIGRRAPDAALERKLDALATRGNAPLYIPADATDLSSLQSALQTILRNFRKVDGVVHSALVLSDQTLMAMDEARFSGALATKVDISVNLDRVFGDLDLDFMLFFSSMMSFLKAPGQSNYAAGCTFKDSFARSLQSRRAYPIKIMNWGYWGNVGVVADEFYRRRMEQAGIGSIDPQEGLKALQMLLGTRLDQIVFFKSLDRNVIADLDVTETATYLPRAVSTDLRQVQQQISRQSANAAERAEILERGQLPTEVDTLASHILAASLRTLGLLQDSVSNHEVTPSAQDRAAFHERWLASSIRYLKETSCLDSEGKLTQEIPDLAALWREWELRREEWSARHAAQLDLLEACLRALPDILSGKRTATEVMFPDSSMRLVEGVYQGNATADYYNDVLGRTLSAYVRQQLEAGAARLRILEIGAGTGGTTARLMPLLQELSGAIAEYCYTDISRAFLIHAEKHYQPLLPSLTTAIFDVSKPVAFQPVTPGRYDVVIATNVLHATPDIRQALRNAKAVLKRNGVLLLNELSTWTLFNHLTFGLLEGWWLHRDSALRLPGSPVLPPAKWAEVLHGEGFSPAIWPAADAHDFGQQVIAAVSDGVVRQPMRIQPPAVAQANVPVSARSSAASGPVAARSGAGSATPLRDRAIEYFRRMIAGSLRMRADQLDPTERFEKYGLDSILVVQLANQVRTVLPDITSTLFFEVQSVQGLVNHLLETRAEAVKALVADSSVSLPSQQANTASEDFPTSRSLALPDTTHRSTGWSRRRIRRATQNAAPARAAFDVAIIGCSGRYPKSPNLDEFWKNLSGGTNCISEIPQDRWNWRDYFDAQKGKAGSIYTRWGGFLEDIDKFDPLFFRISPKEAKAMDPQERLFLEACYHAIEDAGYTPGSLGDVEKVGVFVGVMNSRYNTQPLYYSVANRVSYLFNFQGPSMAVDTACSASLTAIHLALESLYSGLSECAIAGGVNLIIDPAHYQELSALTMLSAGNECRSFGDGADGFVDAEGVGAVILKPLDEAQRDGDVVYGVIKGSAVNAGGRTNGYTVPNPVAQARVVSRALERAGMVAADVSYIEAHGTGTALGDPIEIAGLARAFRESGGGDAVCAIGSLKSNIGHCESAAGIAGLTKVLLQLKHGRLVPSLHSEVPNPEIDFSRTPFRVQRSLQEWKRPSREIDGVVREIPRTAGISSFGAGGANAHIIVQEYAPVAPGVSAEDEPVIVPLSARTPDQLKQIAQGLWEFIHASRRASIPVDISSMAYTLQVGREPMDERVGFLVSSIEELESRLESYLNGEQVIEGVHQGQVKRDKETLALFSADADLQLTVQKWLSDRRLPQLLALWAKGLKVDWSRLYREIKPRRMSLPAYPFARERYWRERVDARAVPRATERAAIGALHPLLHENVSSINQQCYRSTFDGNDILLSDHRLTSHAGEGAQKVLPAAVFLEMARAAIESAVAPSPQGARDRGALELYNVAWADPVLLRGSVQVHVALFPRGRDEMGFEIHGPSERGGDETVHCQGRAILGRQSSAPRIDIDQLKARMRMGTVEPDSHYGALSRRGLRYGPAYQGLAAIYAGDQQLLGEIRVPGGFGDGQSTSPGVLMLHPVVLDSALQTAFRLIPPYSHPSLPLAVESLRVFGECTGEMFAWVRYSGGGHPGPGNVQVDIDLCDGHGNVRVQMRGVTYERELREALAEVAEPAMAPASPGLTPATSFEPHEVALNEPGSQAFENRVSKKPSGIALT